MVEESQLDSGEGLLYQIVIDGLQKTSVKTSRTREGHHDSNEVFTEQVSMPGTTPLAAFWDKLSDLGYLSPDQLSFEEQEASRTSTKTLVHPFEEIEVVEVRPSESGKCINIDDSLIGFTNRWLGSEPTVNISENPDQANGTLTHSLRDGRGLEITFHRTIRMPDDNKLHQLPASLGAFPLFNVSAYADSLPSKIARQGGVFLPMWQREALWIDFRALEGRNYSLRVFVGHINVVSGLTMDERPDAMADPLQDYIILPGQPWLDGICVAPGIVRQFVAMPLGSGYTVEGQKTGEEKHGGLQIKIIPSYEENLRLWIKEGKDGMKEGVSTGTFDRSACLDERKTPRQLSLVSGDKIRLYPANPTFSVPYTISDLTGDIQSGEIHIKHCAKWLTLGVSPPIEASIEYGGELNTLYNCCSFSGLLTNGPPTLSVPEESPSTQSQNNSNTPIATKDLRAMGLAAGGKLVQDIYRDPFPAEIWNTEAAYSVHIHILDPASCEAVTHVVPQPPPIDATTYTKANLPFFVVEEKADDRVDGGDFNNVKSVSAMDNAKGVATESSFDPSKPSMCKACETRLCDCIIRPCDHQFCNVCIKALETRSESSSMVGRRQWKCPSCEKAVLHVAGFAAPMNLPGEETLKVKVPVHVLKVEDGRVKFKSIQRTRI
ncbi:hypothetical protein B7463_g6513, partial [Scytalidium lignicola]